MTWRTFNSIQNPPNVRPNGEKQPDTTTNNTHQGTQITCSQSERAMTPTTLSRQSSHIGEHKHHRMTTSQDHPQQAPDKPVYSRAHKSSHFVQPPLHPSPSRQNPRLSQNFTSYNFTKITSQL